MRVTQKGQVTIPQDIRKALGIEAGTEVRFELDERGARLVTGKDDARDRIARLRGSGDGKLTTDEILAFTRS